MRLYDEGEEEEKKAISDDENEPVWGRSPLLRQCLHYKIPKIAA
jgi:hypothetical protein